MNIVTTNEAGVPTAEPVVILSDFIVAHVGWNQDNKGWIVLRKNGNRAIVLSDNGIGYFAQPADLEAKIAAYELLIETTRDALSVLADGLSDRK